MSEPFCDDILIAALVPSELTLNKVNSQVAAQKNITRVDNRYNHNEH